MMTVLIAFLAFSAFAIAYHTYGRYLARKIFKLDRNAVTPSREVDDGLDYVPTRKEVLFGHHFTSIAGTGPIVGPAIAVFWGWLPAVLWVVLGSIFIGAVHDFGALVVSLRSRGQTIGDVAGRMVSKRARLLVLFILFLALMVVLAIFGLVIAVVFSTYPESVLSAWIAMPVAVVVGLLIHRKGSHILFPSLGALFILYAAVVVGVYYLPITLGGLPLYAGPDAGFLAGLKSSVVIWTFVLLVYCFFASTLPVWLLLQPRDYINSHQLIVALVLLVLGLVVARPDLVAPVYTTDVAGAPPIFPFLFITVACGAVSGFHCLVSSGTSSKQLNNEMDAQYIGYGAMLLEGALAILVILACCAGLGMGVTKDGQILTGLAAWQQFYGGDWQEMGLPQQIGAFVKGGANMMAVLGIPIKLCMGIVAVMATCFATTTIDTATRLQRYVLQEIGGALHIGPLTNKYVATLVAVGTAGALALTPGPKGPGSGGLILWPLFGAINQLLAGLAFMVTAFYLIRHRKPVWFLVLPLILMIVLPAWAMVHQILSFYREQNWLLVVIGLFVECLQVWLVAEGVFLWKRAKGVLPQPLPPLRRAMAEAQSDGA